MVQSGGNYLDGQLLIAMPGVVDGNFARTLVYLCAHSGDGAMGIIVNQPAPKLSFRELLVQLNIIPDDEAIMLTEPAATMKVHRGGPVETGRGFVLHSSDYFIENSTLPIDDDVCLTATLEILKAIADGRGPDQAMLALGYAGWAPGQLEREIQANGWLTCRADRDLLFNPDMDAKYTMALQRLGIDPGLLSTEAGHA